jgi:hypothetical protein
MEMRLWTKQEFRTEGRGQCDGTISAFAWRDWEKPLELLHRPRFECCTPKMKPYGYSSMALTFGTLREMFWVSLFGLCPATRHGGAWGERRYSSYSFTTTALDWGERSASRIGRAFIPGKRTPGTHWTGGWMGPRAGLDTEDREKILCPCRGSNLDRPVVQPVVRHYTAWDNPAPSGIS